MAHKSYDGHTFLASCIVRAESENAKLRWLHVIQELHTFIARQKYIGTGNRFDCSQLYTSQQVDILKVVHAADIIG